WNIPVVGNHGRTTELLLNPLACCQPFIIESRHRVVLTLQSDGLPLSPRAERPDARRSRAGSARAARPDRKRRPDRPPQAPPSLPRAHLLERPAFAFQTQHGGIAVETDDESVARGARTRSRQAANLRRRLVSSGMSLSAPLRWR